MRDVEHERELERNLNFEVDFLSVDSLIGR